MANGQMPNGAKANASAAPTGKARRKANRSMKDCRAVTVGVASGWYGDIYLCHYHTTDLGN
jgi:hypothetical protein